MVSCVNALSRAHSISTWRVTVSYKHNEGVSMPYPGLTPFLLDWHLFEKEYDEMCQCPIPGSLHFYIQVMHGQKSKQCVNALSRAHSISTENMRQYEYGICSVNALSRAHSISTEGRMFMELIQQIVSMPYPGLTPFLQYIGDLKKDKEYCVNALSRAHSISTIYKFI